jgi:hypothetical protein
VFRLLGFGIYVYVIAFATFGSINTVSADGSLPIDCDFELNKISRTVCANAALKRLNAALSMVNEGEALYVGSGPQENSIECGTNVTCLIDAYERLIFRYSQPSTLMPSDYITCSNARFSNDCHDTFVWQSGDKYSGQWRGVARHGLGKQIYVNGNIAVGFWEDNELSGEVKIKFSSGKTFYGEIKNGEYYGQATIYNGGLAYVGVFIEDQGRQLFRGTQYFYDGTSVFNDFLNLLEPLSDSLIRSESSAERISSARKQYPENSSVSDLLMLIFLVLIF